MIKKLKDYLRSLLPIDILVAFHCILMSSLILARHHVLGDTGMHYLARYLIVFLAAFIIVPLIDRFDHPLMKSRIIRFLRYTYPMFLLGPFYRWSEPISTMFFSQPFDPYLLAADVKLFGYNIARELVHRWGDRYWLTEWMNFSYLSYYWVTLYLPLYLYFKGRIKEYLEVIFISGVVVFFCFFFQALFPALGPIYHDPTISGHLVAGPITYAAHIFMTYADVPGSAMPSAHIAGTLAIFFLAWKYWRRAFWLTSLVVISLSLATVYCRFHYAVDGIAAIFVTFIGVFIIGPRLYAYLFPHLAAPPIIEEPSNTLVPNGPGIRGNN